MSNRQAGRTTQRIDNQLDQSNAGYNSLVGGWRDRAGSLEGRSDRDYGTIQEGYLNLLRHGGNLQDGGRPGGGGGGGGGGSSAPEFTWGRGEYEKLRPFIKSLGADLSPEDKARMRGGGVYEDFAKTGGVSDAEAGNLRLRASRTGRSAYDSLNDQLATQNAAQGGFNPGYGAQTAKLARDTARAASDASTDAEGDILGMRREGRLAGASGLASTEGALQNLLMQRILGAGGLQEALASGMLGADTAEAGDRRAGESIAASRGAASAALDLQRELGALGGLNQLYGSSPGELTDYNSNILRGLGQQDQAAGNYLGLRMQNNPNTSVWDRIAQIGGMAAPLIGAFGGGGPKRSTGGYFSAPQGGFSANTGGISLDPRSIFGR